MDQERRGSRPSRAAQYDSWMTLEELANNTKFSRGQQFDAVAAFAQARAQGIRSGA